MVLLLASVLFTLVVGIGMIRWLAPELLGVPTDLQLVQIDHKVPPFYENIFRREDFESGEFLIKDPYTKVRAKPFFPSLGGAGPHDILGFRNHGVPNVADVIVIGDSQTYGVNAPMDLNWPHKLKEGLSEKKISVYSMATGGWGPVQYLDMFAKAAAFQPRVVVVAFYTGNDPMEALQMAYGVEKWRFLQTGPRPSSAGHVTSKFPAPDSEEWPVEFGDGVKTVFSPKLRLVSNQIHPKVRAGYQVISKVAGIMAELAKSYSQRTVFTIIPTKELVYARKVEQEQLVPPREYSELVEAESENIRTLAALLMTLPDVTYVDLVEPFQEAALTSLTLYPRDANGHPTAAGYRVIAEELVGSIDPMLPEKPIGLVAVQVGPEEQVEALVKDEGVWVFSSDALIRGNGWDTDHTPVVQRRDIAGLPRRGTVESVDPKRFGPAAFP